MKRDEVEPQAGFTPAVTHASQFQTVHIVITAAAIFRTEY